MNSPVSAFWQQRARRRRWPSTDGHHDRPASQRSGPWFAARAVRFGHIAAPAEAHGQRGVPAADREHDAARGDAKDRHSGERHRRPTAAGRFPGRNS